jgi:putative transposase
VKTTESGGPSGYDAEKKVKGQKRHIFVDVMGLLIAAKVHEADIQDRDGANPVDMGRRGEYAGKRVDWVRIKCGWTLEIVRRKKNTVGFAVLPRQWVVERTF